MRSDVSAGTCSMRGWLSSLPVARAVAVGALIAVLFLAIACSKATQSPAENAATGVALQMPVTVKGAANLGSLQLDLEYDSRVFDLQGVNGGPLTRGRIVDSNRSTPGKVRLVAVAGPGISGDGVVFYLTFVASGQTKASDITVVAIEAVDTDLQELTVTASPGHIAAGNQVEGIVLNFQK